MPLSSTNGKNGKSVVGVIGLGIVGGAVGRYFRERGYSLRHFDPYRGLDDEGALNEADVVFVCVPTPHLAGAGFDDSAVEEAVSRLRQPKLIVVKSTVLPGTTEAYQLRYPQHGFLFNPEFLREASAYEDFLQPDRQLVGYTAQTRHLAGSFLAMLPDAPYSVVMTAREAEMAKYMTNAFLAVKVMFANEMHDLCTALEIDYAAARDAIAADARIGPSHLDVLDGGYRGYGGKCLPKDAKALLSLADRLEVPLRVLRAADRANALLRLDGEAEQALAAPSLFTLVGDEEAVSEERAA